MIASSQHVMSTFSRVFVIECGRSTRYEPCLHYRIMKSADVRLLAYLAIGMSAIAINVVLDDTCAMHIPGTTTIGTNRHQVAPSGTRSSRWTRAHPPPLRHAQPSSNMPVLS